MVLLVMISLPKPEQSFVLKFKIKPISTNNAYYTKNRSFTKDARRWRHKFMKQIMSDYNQKQIETIKKTFDKKRHMISLTWLWLQPKSILFTNAGHISLQSFDVDNILKIPTDCLFDKRYNDKWVSNRKGAELTMYQSLPKINNLQLGDQFVVSTTSIKAPSLNDEYELILHLDILPLFS